MSSGNARAALDAVWRRSDEAFALLTPDALFDQPIALRQPVIFYVGHLPAFAWNQLARGLRGCPPFDPASDELFARGIDPVGVDEYQPPRPEEWPAPAAVDDYRDRVRERLRELARGLDLQRADERRAFETVIEHERMHHETLLYMFEQLPSGKKIAPARPKDDALRAAAPGRVGVGGGRVRLGVEPGTLPFGWDNEFGRLDVDVDDFTVDTTPVRNAEFRAFVEAGGYRDRRLWDADGWAWRERRQILHPIGWLDRDGGFAQRTFFGERNWEEARDWPVSVSFAEAEAYARWRGARLPTEAEFHRAAYSSPDGAVRAHPWGDARPGDAHGNFGFRRWDPAPVGAFPDGASAWGIHELVGNGWEWTSTPFGPLPGFEPMPNYAGYSQDFFDGQHRVLLGASWATDDAFLRKSFRNWFQPHYPFVFSKFRCVSRA